MVEKEVRFFEPSEPLDRERHRGLRWKCLEAQCPVNCCLRARDTSIALHEIPSASRFFPVVFPYTKREDGSLSLDVRVVYALTLGYTDVDDEAGCVYLDPNRGCLLGEDRLIACKKYPFTSRNVPGTDQIGLIIGLDCPGWSYEDGELMVDEEGELTQYAQKNFVDPLFSFISGNQIRQVFLKTIEDLKLLVPRDIIYKDIRVRVNTIDIEKLKAFDPHTLKKLVQNDFLRVIYHAFDSLANFTILIDRYLERKSR